MFNSQSVLRALNAGPGTSASVGAILLDALREHTHFVGALVASEFTGGWTMVDGYGVLAHSAADRDLPRPLFHKATRERSTVHLSADEAVHLVDFPPGLGGFLIAPFICRGYVLGALVAAVGAGRDVPDDDRRLLEHLAELGAAAFVHIAQRADESASAAGADRRSDILARTARSLSSVGNAEALFDELNRVASDLLGTSGLTVYEIAPSSGAITVRYVGGRSASELAVAGSRVLENPAFVDTLRDGIEAFRENVHGSYLKRWFHGLGITLPEDYKSHAQLPLHVEGQLRGALGLRWSVTRAFPPLERDLLRDFATQVSLVLRNADRLDAERRSREGAEAAAAIARAALRAEEPGLVIAKALEAIDRAIPSLGKAIALFDDSRTTIRYLGVSGQLSALAGRSVAVRESAAEIASIGDPRPVQGAERIRLAEADVIPEGALLIPLYAHDQLLGVLWSVPDPRRPAAQALEELRNLSVSLALVAEVIALNAEEHKRRERERMLATALATMDQPVLIVGLDRRILYANAAAVHEYGFPFDAIASFPFDRLVDSASVAERPANDSEQSDGGVWVAQHVHRRRDGTTFPVSVQLSHIRDDTGAPIGQVVTVRNLTEERRIEEQLRQSEKLAALGELVAGVAHELNNPLAGISAFAQLLLEDPLGEEQHESVRLIKREADRAVNVIRDLLLFSRKSGPSESLVDLNEMVELTLRLRGYGLRSAGIDVRVELDASLPRVPGDPQRLQQVLLNLVVNAEHALHRSDVKRLVVKTSQSAAGATVTISDSGTGMDEETRTRIFEPFFTTKPPGEGTGLGLSVSYGIVRAHRGSIEVESSPGLGTTFRIELPKLSPRASLSA